MTTRVKAPPVSWRPLFPTALSRRSTITFVPVELIFFNSNCFTFPMRLRSDLSLRIQYIKFSTHCFIVIYRSDSSLFIRSSVFWVRFKQGWYKNCLVFSSDQEVLNVLNFKNTGCGEQRFKLYCYFLFTLTSSLLLKYFLITECLAWIKSFTIIDLTVSS